MLLYLTNFLAEVFFAMSGTGDGHWLNLTGQKPRTTNKSQDSPVPPGRITRRIKSCYCRPITRYKILYPQVPYIHYDPGCNKSSIILRFNNIALCNMCIIPGFCIWWILSRGQPFSRETFVRELLAIGMPYLP